MDLLVAARQVWLRTDEAVDEPGILLKAGVFGFSEGRDRGCDAMSGWRKFNTIVLAAILLALLAAGWMVDVTR